MRFTRTAKGLGYILTGMALIILGLSYSGIALHTYSQMAPDNTAAPAAIFWITLLTVVAWGSYLIVRGWHHIDKDVKRIIKHEQVIPKD